MFNTVTKAQMQELIEYIASKMSVIDVSTIADANNVEEGYFNETDNKFYEEANYTTEITGKNKTIYISLNTDLPYYFNGTDFVALSSPQQDTLDAGDGIDITDNTISIDEMPAEDMSEVASPMPSVMSRRFKYSTEEQIVGEWIDGKKLYQKTIHDFTMPSQSNVPIPNFLGIQVDKMIEIFGRCVDSNGFTFTFNPSFGDRIKCLYGTSNDAFVVQYVDASWAYNQKADITFVYTKVND